MDKILLFGIYKKDFLFILKMLVFVIHQIKNVNNVDMSSLRAPWQNGPYKNQHRKQHKYT